MSGKRQNLGVNQKEVERVRRGDTRRETIQRVSGWFNLRTEEEFVRSQWGFVIFFIIAIASLWEWLILGVAHWNLLHVMNGLFWFGLSLYALYKNRKLQRVG